MAFHLKTCLALAAAIATLPLASAEAEGAVTKSVRAKGLAAIIEGDEAAAFQRAKAAALREAVEEAVGTLITGETRVRNFAVIEDDILTGTSGFVSDFVIVEQGPQADTYMVVVDASVSLAALSASILGSKLLLEAIDRPRVVCVARMRTAPADGSRTEDWGRATAALQEALEIELNSIDLLKPQLDAAAYRRVMDDPAVAAEWGQKEGADIIVIAQIAVQGQRNLPIPFADSNLGELSIHSVFASARIEAFWCDSREILSTISISKRAAGSSFEAAAKNATDATFAALAKRLVVEMMENWREKVYSGRTISVTVRGTRPQADYFEREFPLRVAGIEKLYPRSFEAGLATYDARSKSPAFHVARELSAKGLGELDVEIVQVTSNTMQLVLSN